MNIKKIKTLLDSLIFLSNTKINTQVESILHNVNRSGQYKSPEILTSFKYAKSELSPEGLELCRKIIIIKSIIKYWDDAFSNKFSSSIQAEFISNFNRIFELCEQDGWSKYNDDVYWKDLGISNTTLFPVPSGIVETSSGFGIRQGISKNLWDTLKFITFTALHGRKNYYQIHTHTPLLMHFNEKSWARSYSMLVEMVSLNNNIQGVFRSSWFFDPTIKNISPHLSYLRDFPKKTSALICHSLKDTSCNAISKSKSRKKLYELGEYQPTIYLVIWSRNAFLKIDNSKRNN